MRLGRWAGVLGMVALCAMLNAQTVDLKQDERLQKPITVREPLIPLKQLLAQISKELGVSLSVTSDIAADKVCVLVRERPAYEVLQRLADTLRYEWQASEATGGYRLYQPLMERTREQQLRQALLQARRQTVERALRVLIELARRVRWEELTRLGEQGSERLSPEQARLLPRLYNMGIYAAARVMGDFRAAEWQRFWQGETLVFSSAPRTGELPLAAEISQLILEGRPNLWMRSKAESVRGDARETVVRLRLRWDNWRGEMTVLTERQTNTSAQRTPQGSALIPIGIATTMGSLSARDLMDRARSQEQSTTLLDDHPLNKVWREWANVSDRLTPSRPTTTRSERIVLPDYLQRSPLAALVEIATRYGLDLYADAYRLELFPEMLPATRTLLLNRTLPTDWSEIRAMFWLRQEGDALMARHKDYFWLRPSEIPEESLRPLEVKKASSSKQGEQPSTPITLDDWARFADSLNELQIERLIGLPLVSNSYVRTSSTLNLRSVATAIPALRFWATLTPQQKQVALSGEPLFLRRLSLGQQQRFQQALYASTSRALHAGTTSVALEAVTPQILSLYESGMGTAPEVMEPHFRLVHGRQQMVMETSDNAATETKSLQILLTQPSESAESERSSNFYLFRFVLENLTREYPFSPDNP